MNINLMIEPIKVLDFGEVKVTIKGTTPIVEQYIEELLYAQYKTAEDRMEGGREYVKRLIACSIKDVKGLSINEQEFVVKFKKQKIEEIDDYSYNIIMRVFDHYIKADFVQPVMDFYQKNKEGVAGIELEEADKKKD